MNPKPLRLLLAEDYDDDALLVQNALERQGFAVDCTRVMTAAAFRSALVGASFDIILCDHVMPGFSATEALEIVKACGTDVPFIIVSGTIGESVAVEAMRGGAADYIFKDNLTRLGVAVERELREAETRRQKRLFDSFSNSQTEVLEMILNRVPVTGILTRIIERVESLSPGNVICSIMLVNSEGTHLDFTAGPRVPAEFSERVKSVPIKVDMGSCGTAAALAKTVVVEDTATDPAWSRVREITARHELRSCWSVPVFSSNQRVIGTIAVYHPHVHVPTAEELRWVESATKLVTLAIERGRAAEKLRNSESLFRIASHAARVGGWTVDLPELKITWSEQVCAIHEMPVGTVPDLEQAMNFYPPEWRARLAMVFEKCEQEGIGFDERMEIITGKGNRVWVRSVGEAIYGDDGKIIRIQGAFQDITYQRKLEQAEEANRSNEVRYLAQRNALISLNGQAAESGSDLMESLRRINEIAARTLEVASTSIWKLTPDKELLVCLDCFEPADSRHSSGATLVAAEYENYFETLSRMELIAADDACNDPATREFSKNYLEPNGIASTLDLPVRFGRDRSYFMCNEHAGDIRHWTSDEKTFAIAIANHVSLALESHERERAQAELLQSRQRFQSVAAATNDTIWDWNLETDDFWWYEGVANLYGSSPVDSEASVHRWIRKIHPEDRERVVRKIREAIDNGATRWSDEYRFVSEDGTLAYLSDRGEILRDAAGKAIRMVGGMTDLTEKKAAELELTRSHRALLMLSSCNEMLVRTTSESGLLAEACRIAVDVGGYQMAWVGYVGEEAENGLVSVAHAGDEPGDFHEVMVSWLDEPEGLSLRKGTAISAGDLLENPAFAVWLPLARERDYRSLICLPLHDQKRVFGMLCLCGAEVARSGEDEMKMLHEMSNDIAFGIENIRGRLERQQADARIREQASLLDKARDAILVRDLDHRITYWNKSAERLYGWSADEVIGQRIHEVLNLDLPAFDEAHEHTLFHGEWNGELKQVDKSGRERVIECRWTLVRDEQGQPESVLVLNTDISEQRNLEMQFLRAQRIESIGTLAGGIAHDLNNILAPISMATELLKMRVTEPRSGELLDTIATSATRGAEMVGQILSFSRGAHGRPVEVHPLQIIREIEGILRDTLLRKVELEVKADRDLWLIKGDPTQLHQVILNLCVNARDALDEGGKITIRAGNVQLDEAFAASNLEAAAGPHIYIEVEDTGSGIQPEIMERVFDPFFTTKSVGKGTGLGLSTSLAIVKNHGGFIRAESKPGVGSRFRIYFPALPDQADDEVERHHLDLPKGSGEAILVIDDEENIREVTRHILEAHGYRVLLAPNGGEAVDLFRVHRSDIQIVLTDMMMPGMDGATTIRELCEIDPSVRIIATSGVHSNGDIAGASGNGVARFLRKPYTAEALLESLDEILKEAIPNP